MPTHALILFAHGARDARWSHTLADLGQRVAGRRPDWWIARAFLEFQPPTLIEALDQAVTAGCRTIDVLPVFWASGGHVANDVPPLLDVFRAAQPQVTLNVLPVLSELPGLLDFIADAATATRPQT